VTISVRAADPKGVAAVSLFYRVDGGRGNSTPMTLQTEGFYTGTIPGQAASATCSFTGRRGRDWRSGDVSAGEV